MNSTDKQDFELLSITDIFNSGNRRLRIPDYQRGYSWEISQRKDLIDDIEYIIKGDMPIVITPEPLLLPEMKSLRIGMELRLLISLMDSREQPAW